MSSWSWAVDWFLSCFIFRVLFKAIRVEDGWGPLTEQIGDHGAWEDDTKPQSRSTEEVMFFVTNSRRRYNERRHSFSQYLVSVPEKQPLGKKAKAEPRGWAKNAFPKVHYVDADLAQQTISSTEDAVAPSTTLVRPGSPPRDLSYTKEDSQRKQSLQKILFVGQPEHFVYSNNNWKCAGTWSALETRLGPRQSTSDILTRKMLTQSLRQPDDLTKVERAVAIIRKRWESGGVSYFRHLLLAHSRRQISDLLPIDDASRLMRLLMYTLESACYDFFNRESPRWLVILRVHTADEMSLEVWILAVYVYLRARSDPRQLSDMLVRKIAKIRHRAVHALPYKVRTFKFAFMLLDRLGDAARARTLESVIKVLLEEHPVSTPGLAFSERLRGASRSRRLIEAYRVLRGGTLHSAPVLATNKDRQRATAAWVPPATLHRILARSQQQLEQCLCDFSKRPEIPSLLNDPLDVGMELHHIAWRLTGLKKHLYFAKEDRHVWDYSMHEIRLRHCPLPSAARVVLMTRRRLRDDVDLAWAKLEHLGQHHPQRHMEANLGKFRLRSYKETMQKQRSTGITAYSNAFTPNMTLQATADSILADAKTVHGMRMDRTRDFRKLVNNTSAEQWRKLWQETRAMQSYFGIAGVGSARLEITARLASMLRMCTQYGKYDYQSGKWPDGTEFVDLDHAHALSYQDVKLV